MIDTILSIVFATMTPFFVLWLVVDFLPERIAGKNHASRAGIPLDELDPVRVFSSDTTVTGSKSERAGNLFQSSIQNERRTKVVRRSVVLPGELS